MNDRVNHDVKVRGQVEKYLPVFRDYVKRYGEKTVKDVLRDGKGHGLKLRLPLNGKDRRQMIIALEL
jgi:hypothetical protein